MKQILLERSQVEYSDAAIKTLDFALPPNSKCFRMHWHDRLEILLIKKGSMYVDSGTTTTRLSANELMMIPPKSLHSGYTKGESVEYAVLMLDIRNFYNETDLCKNLLPAIYDGRASFNTVSSNNKIIRLVNDLCNNQGAETLETVSKVYHLFSLFYQTELINLQSEPQNASVKKIVDYLEENASQEVDVKSLCEAFGYTPAHLCRKFKKATGLPPMTYLKIFRLEKARETIKNSDLSISQIAAECGFADANYFTRCFRAHFGTPPSRFKKS